VIPTWVLWLWALAGVLVAAFLAWRDEYRRSNAILSKTPRPRLVLEFSEVDIKPDGNSFGITVKNRGDRAISNTRFIFVVVSETRGLLSKESGIEILNELIVSKQYKFGSETFTFQPNEPQIFITLFIQYKDAVSGALYEETIHQLWAGQKDGTRNTDLYQCKVEDQRKAESYALPIIERFRDKLPMPPSLARGKSISEPEPTS
jgi:hypothetical protein